MCASLEVSPDEQVFRLWASYLPAFPSRFFETVATRVFVPITAAGQRRIRTGFLTSIRTKGISKIPHSLCQEKCGVRRRTITNRVRKNHTPDCPSRVSS